jgi:hypothetical protein
MLLSNASVQQRRVILLGLAGALLLCTLFVLPRGQALASALVLFFRGQTIQPIATDYAHLQNAYRTLEELERLGTLQGTLPRQLTTASSTAAAGALAGFSVAQPATLPNGINAKPSSIKVLAPTEVTLTLNAAQANAYLKSIGSSQTLPATYDGEQLIVGFPGVAVLEYTGPTGDKLYVGQAGQLTVNAAGSADVAQLRAYLLTLPGLSPDTARALENITAWQTTLPLGIPTDRVGWTPTIVGGALGGSGVLLDDKSGIASAVFWERGNHVQTLGVGGWGITSSEVQTVASSLN